MAAGDYRLGIDGKFLYGTAGSTATTESDAIETCNLNLTARAAEALRRGKTWVANKTYALEATLSFTFFDIEGDGLLTAIQAAFLNRTKVALYAKDAASGQGIDADWYITSFSRDESNSDFIKYSAEAKPTDEQRNPAWA